MNTRRGAPADVPRFDRVAGIYRVLEYVAFGRALETARLRYLDRLTDCRDVLVIGEGDGRVLQRILAIAPRAQIRCIDSSPAMLTRAAARLDAAARDRVSFECADARTVAIDHAACDAVVTMFVLDCFSPRDVSGLVSRLAAGLRPHGLWLFADFVIPETGWRRWRATLWVSFLYAFFRWRTGLAVRVLPPSEEILHGAGLSVVHATTLQRGLLRTAVYERAAQDAGPDTRS